MGIEINTVPPQTTAARIFRSRERLEQKRRFHPVGRMNWLCDTSAFPRWLALTSLLGALGAAAQPTQTVTLAWNPSSDPTVVGYFRYYGGSSGAYTNKADAGAVTNASVSGLLQGDTYYFTVTAYDSSGLESLPSQEVSYTVAAATNPTVPPSITGQPASQTVAAGANATFVVTASGTTPLTYQWLFNGTTLTGATNSNLVLNNVQSNQAGGYSARVANSAGSAISAVAQLNVTGVPPPWQSADIGTPATAGGASVSNSTYLVSGAGNLSGSADNFHFLYQPLTGDGSITAQISNVTNSTPNGRLGVMIRESLTSSSRYAFMGISSNCKFRYQRRRATGGSRGTTTSSLSTLPNTWVRLIRSGGSFGGYQSTDGTNWTLVYSGGITMAANPYIGFAVASGVSNVLSTAVFNSATVVP